MTTFQKVIKYLAMAFAIFLVVSILSGLLGAIGGIGSFFTGDTVLEESKVYPVSGQIHSLELDLNAADLTIRHADAFCVESNLKYLTVSEADGVLTVKDKKKAVSTYTDATLTLYIPAQMTFDTVRITTGAAKLTADAISARTVKLQLGAGDVTLQSLTASQKARIEGGAGRITVVGGSLNDLELEMGVGELNLTAALLGSSELRFGVGQSNLTLLGSKADYRVDMEKGIGNITVDGKNVSDYASSGTGDRFVQIEGGVGAIHLRFQDPEA